MIFDILNESFEKWPNKKAVICDGIVKTYAQLNDNVELITQEMIKCEGIANNNVLLAMDNSIEFVESFFAINRAGGTIVPVYMNMGEHKLRSIVEHYEIKCILTLNKYREKFEAVLEGSENFLEIDQFIVNWKG